MDVSKSGILFQERWYKIIKALSVITLIIKVIIYVDNIYKGSQKYGDHGYLLIKIVNDKMGEYIAVETSVN